MNIRLLCTIFFMLLTTSPAAGAARYAVASAPAPVFSSPDAGSLSGRHIQLDSCGQPRGLEFIALPGTTFTITDELRIEGEKIYKVVTGDYPYPSSKGYYLHEKHVLTTDTKPPERARVLPQADEIVERMVNAVDTPYLWGSNVRDGLKLHSVGSAQASAGLRGIDCSGLLYEATDGYTPRNTSSLSGYGAAVPITGLSAEEIAKKLRPLDLIVWMGHVLIVLDGNRVIESRLRCGAPGNGGVHISSIKERLRAIVKKKKPANSGESDGTFIVRRWFPAVASEGDIPQTYHPVNGFSEKL